MVTKAVSPIIIAPCVSDVVIGAASVAHLAQLCAEGCFMSSVLYQTIFFFTSNRNLSTIPTTFTAPTTFSKVEYYFFIGSP